MNGGTEESPTSRPAVGARLFALLLRLYPHRFGQRFRDEMLVFYRLHRHDARFAGFAGGLRFWAHTLGDVAATAWTQHLEARDSSGGLRGIAQDAKYALRGVLRDPLYAVIAMSTLALGMGATTAVFGVVHGVLITPLDYPEPDSLVRVYEREHDNPGARMVAYGNYDDLRRSTGVFEELAVWTWETRVLTGIDRATTIRARATSANLVVVFRAGVALGRWFSADEETEGLDVVVLSDELWRNRFDADPSIVGRSATLDGKPYAVVGVMEPGFDFPVADAWVPLPPVTSPQGLRRWHRHNMVGRLQPTVSAAEANLAIGSVAERLEAAHPDTNTGNYFEVIPLREDVVGDVRPALRMLFAGVGTLLVIACVNLTSLSLARAATRSPEFALRQALGGSAIRLGRMLVVESVGLSLVGGLLGIGIARLALSTVAALAGSSVPRLDSVELGLPVFLFSAAVSLGTGIVVGLAPVIRLAFGREVNATMLLGGSRASSTRGVIRTRRFLVVAELALALVLTTGAGLLVRSLAALQAVDIGADTSELLAFDIDLPRGATYGGRPGGQLMEGALSHIEALPGVERAAAVLTPPATPGGWGATLTIRGRPVPEAELPSVHYNVVSSGYFETLGVQLLEGRGLTPDDPIDDLPVALINRAAAEKYWPGDAVLGQEIMGTEDGRLPWLRIVGIVDNIQQSLTRPAEPEVFVPMAHDWIFNYVVLARSPGDVLAAAAEADAIFRRADSDIPVQNMGTFAGRLGSSIAQPRLNAALMSAFAGIALLTAGIGVYGVLAYSVAARRKELGIRVAIGATRAQVLGAVLRDVAKLAQVALVIGIGGALIATRLLEGMLFGVQPMDTATLGVAAVSMLFVALVAALLPARAAVAVDPVNALRDE